MTTLFEAVANQPMDQVVALIADLLAGCGKGLCAGVFRWQDNGGAWLQC